MRTAFKGLGFVLVATLIWIVLPLDGLANHYFRSAQPDINRHGGGAKTAVVFFTGIQSSGEAHAAPLIDIWKKHGDVIVVEYNRQRFDGNATAYATYRKLVEWGYERAILIGASKGGLLATDVIDFDRASDKHLQYAVMLQDAPRGKDDIQDSGLFEFVTTAWYPGPVTNAVLTDLFWHFAFSPPAPYLLGEGVNQQQLEAHHDASSNYPLSGWAGELRYIAGHRDFERNQYVGIPLIVMEAEYDSTVKRTAEAWKVVFGGGTIIEVGGASHVDFVQHPLEWRRAFEKGFTALKGW